MQQRSNQEVPSDGEVPHLREVPYLLTALQRTEPGSELRRDFLRWYVLRLRRFEDFSARNLTMYRRLRVPALIAATIVPAAIAWNTPNGRLVATVLSVFVAAATALEEFLSAGRRWRHYRAAVEPLKAEGWMYVALADEYATFSSHEEAFPRFATRVGRALNQETEDYISHTLAQRTPDSRGTEDGTPGSS
jgi:hypothetical protein